MGALATLESVSVYRSPQGSSPALVRPGPCHALLVGAASAASAMSEFLRAHWTALESTADIANAEADANEPVCVRLRTSRSHAEGEMQVQNSHASGEHGEIADFLRAFEHATEMNRTEMSELIGVSRPAYYGYLGGTQPRSPQLKRIDALKQLAEEIRRGYFTRPADKASVLAWLDEYLVRVDRAALGAALKKGRTTFAADPDVPGRLVRTNPDGSEDRGWFIDGRFVPDTTTS